MHSTLVTLDDHRFGIRLAVDSMDLARSLQGGEVKCEMPNISQVCAAAVTTIFLELGPGAAEDGVEEAAPVTTAVDEACALTQKLQAEMDWIP